MEEGQAARQPPSDEKRKSGWIRSQRPLLGASRSEENAQQEGGFTSPTKNLKEPDGSAPAPLQKTNTTPMLRRVAQESKSSRRRSSSVAETGLDKYEDLDHDDDTTKPADTQPNLSSSKPSQVAARLRGESRTPLRWNSETCLTAATIKAPKAEILAPKDQFEEITKPKISQLRPPSHGPSPEDGNQYRFILLMVGDLEAPQTNELPQVKQPKTENVEVKTQVNKKVAAVPISTPTAARGGGGYQPVLPKPVPGSEDVTIIQIACGKTHLVTVDNEGNVYTFGRGRNGQLGLGKEKTTANSLQRVAHINNRAVLISCGPNSTGVVTSKRDLYLFGTVPGAAEKEGQFLPKQVAFPNARACVDFSLGEEHCIAIIADPESFKRVIGETIIPGERPGRTDSFSAAVSVCTWGKGNKGQLGLGDNVLESETPTVVPFFNSNRAFQVSAGSSHCVVVTKDGRLFVFGDVGQSDHAAGSDKFDFIPVEVKLEPVSFVSSCEKGIVAVTMTDQVYAWGPGVRRGPTPEKVMGIADMGKVSSVSISRNICLASCGHRIVVWGRNSLAFFHLPVPGHGSVQEELAVTLPPPLDFKAAALCCSTRSTFFLKEVPYFSIEPQLLLKFEKGHTVPRIFEELVIALEVFKDEEGIFRLSCNTALLTAVIKNINKSGQLPHQIKTDPHALASLLKKFIQNLPRPLLLPEVFNQLCNTVKEHKTASHGDTSINPAEFSNVLPLSSLFDIRAILLDYQSDEVRREMLKMVLNLLKLVEKSGVNQMSRMALQVCWTPCLLGSMFAAVGTDTSSFSSMNIAPNTKEIILLLLQYGSAWFEEDGYSLVAQYIEEIITEPKLPLQFMADTLQESSKHLGDEKTRSLVQPFASVFSKSVLRHNISSEQGITVWHAYSIILEYCLPPQTAVDKIISSLRRLWISGNSEVFELGIRLVTVFASSGTSMTDVKSEISLLVSILGVSDSSSLTLSENKKTTVGAGNRLLRISMLDDF